MNNNQTTEGNKFLEIIPSKKLSRWIRHVPTTEWDKVVLRYHNGEQKELPVLGTKTEIFSFGQSIKRLIKPDAGFDIYIVNTAPISVPISISPKPTNAESESDADGIFYENIIPKDSEMPIPIEVELRVNTLSQQTPDTKTEGQKTELTIRDIQQHIINQLASSDLPIPRSSLFDQGYSRELVVNAVSDLVRERKVVVNRPADKDEHYISRGQQYPSKKTQQDDIFKDKVLIDQLLNLISGNEREEYRWADQGDIAQYIENILLSEVLKESITSRTREELNTNRNQIIAEIGKKAKLALKKPLSEAGITYKDITINW